MGAVINLHFIVLQACRVAPWNCLLTLTRNPCCWNARHLQCSAENWTSTTSICPSFKVSCCYWIFWKFKGDLAQSDSKNKQKTVLFFLFLLERLTETLRMNPSPAVSAQMFLMFRVFLLRISTQHLTSLWPIMVTELVIINFSKNVD